MNHLTKVIQFYKTLKESDVLAIEKIIKSVEEGYYLKYSKRIIIEDFIFNYYQENIEDEKCVYCFETIYNINLILIPLFLNGRYFYIKPKRRQVLNKHFEIIDFVHKTNSLNETMFSLFFEFTNLFPSFMIINSDTLHNHFEASLIDAPLFKQDATLLFDDVYLVNWHLTTLLIKDNDLKNIVDEYTNAIAKCKNPKHDVIFFKRNTKYYLYIILKSKNTQISTWEAIGVFDIKTNQNSLTNEFNNAKEKLKQEKINL